MKFNSWKYIGLPAVIIIGAIIITIAVLSYTDNVLINDDLTNAVTFSIELGIGIFIAVIVYFVAKFQQLKTETIVSDIKSFNDNLLKQRNTMENTYNQIILTCLKNLWLTNKSILFNVRSKSLDETWIPKDKPLSDIIETNKKQALQYLEELNSLTIMSSSVLDSKLVSKLIRLKQQLEDNFVQTGMFQATRPFSTNIERIYKFVKEYFPPNIHEFDISKIEKYLDNDAKKW